MSEKGRVKPRETQMPSLLGQMCFFRFDERSDPGKPKVFRGSALRYGEYPQVRVSPAPQ